MNMSILFLSNSLTVIRLKIGHSQLNYFLKLTPPIRLSNKIHEIYNLIIDLLKN